MHTVQYNPKVFSFNIININNLRPTAKGTTLVEPTVNKLNFTVYTTICWVYMF